MKIKIEVSYDGWCISTDTDRYYWEHNEEDYGTGALATLFSDLGYEVELEEVY